MHRRHHEVADKPGDMHSPNLHGTGLVNRIRGFIHAHYTWMLRHEYPNVAHYAPDLLRDRWQVWASRHYYSWVLLGLAIPTVIGGLVTMSWWGALTGFLWGGAVRMFVVEQAMSALNSIPAHHRHPALQAGRKQPQQRGPGRSRLGRGLAQQPPRLPQLRLLRAAMVQHRSRLLVHPAAGAFRTGLGRARARPRSNRRPRGETGSPPWRRSKRRPDRPGTILETPNDKGKRK